MAFFEQADAGSILALFEGSYASDLVNLLLDLKKSTVKRLLETLAAHRRKGVAETVTLYYYKEYLTNPLPLRVETDAGETCPNFYAVLGVPREAADEDVRQAYRLLSRAHSPDVFSPAMRKFGDERLKEIHEAFENLKNPQRRARTDRLLPNICYLYPRRDQTWLEAAQRILV